MTMQTLREKLIVYDSNCKVCSALRDLVLKLTTIPKTKVKAYAELTPDLTRHVDAAKFKNVMALIDTAGGKTLYGAEGIAYIFANEYKVVGLLFRFKPFFKLFTLLYKTTAYNRYIIATPKSKFSCDCFPDRVVKYRIGYIAICFLVALMLTALFGISLNGFSNNITLPEAAGQMVLIAGTGWVAQIVLGILFLKGQALDYTGHLGSIMVIGLLLLCPWMIFHFVTGIEDAYLPTLSVFVSFATMLYLHVSRTKYLGLSQGWTLTWVLLLQFTAIAWIYVFYLR
jgi:hypothetical protein